MGNKTSGTRGWASLAIGLLLASRMAIGAAPGRTCVVALETEVRETGGSEHISLGSWVDQQVFASLQQDQEFELLDRSAVDSLLKEKTLNALGADQAKAIGAIRSAGVLVVPVLTVSPDNGFSRLELRIEAVKAFTGQLLGELWLSSKELEGKWGDEAALKTGLTSLREQVHQSLANSDAKPLVEVADAKVISTGGRIQWLADDLVDTLRAGVGQERGVILLQPRQALSTKEERLLEVMGLASRAGAGRRSSVSADITIAVEVEEPATKETEFGRTPLSVKLSVSGREGIKPFSVTTTIGRWEAERKGTGEWLSGCLKQMGAGTPRPPEEDEARAKQQAQQEMMIVRQLIAVARGSRGDDALGSRIAQRAMRAAHLDPSLEEAARRVALDVESLYAVRGQRGNIACDDRIILECQRYLDRFPSQLLKDSPRLEVQGRLAGAAFQRLMPAWGKWVGNWAEIPQNASFYRYARLFLDYGTEVDLLCDNSSNIQSSAVILREILFPHCPPEQLDDERAHWQKYWAEKVEPRQYKDVMPWDCIEIGYWAAKKDWQKVRGGFESLAQRHPRENEMIWGRGAVEVNEGKPYWRRRMAPFLKRAGDPQWETWVPGDYQGQAACYVNGEQWQRLFERLCPVLPSAWDYKLALRMKTQEHLQVPETVVKQGIDARNWWCVDGARFLLAVGDDIWIATPGVERTDLGVSRGTGLHFANKTMRDARVWQQVQWPPPRRAKAQDPGEKPSRVLLTCMLVTRVGTEDVVLAGTTTEGLACFRRRGEGWEGRWLDERGGLPSRYVADVRPCIYDGRPQWLVAVVGPSPDGSLCVMDPQTGEVTLLTTLRFGVNLDHTLVAHWEDGVALPISRFDQALRPERDIKRVVRWSQQAWATYIPLRQDADEFRMLRTECPPEGGRLWELDPRTMVNRQGVAIDGARQKIGGELPPEMNFRGVFGGSPMWASHAPSDWTISPMPSWGEWVCQASADGVIWMATPRVQWVAASYPALVGYRPPPVGTKDWYGQDQWIGPFLSPEGDNISALTPDGRGCIWVSTAQGGNYRVPAESLLKQATAAGMVRSSAEWRKEYEKRLQTMGWRYEVRLLLSKGELTAARKLLDACAPADQLDAAIYRALTFTKQPDGWDEAARVYSELAHNPKAEPPLRMLAYSGWVQALEHAGRWDDLLKACEDYQRVCPQVSEHGADDSIGTVIERAKKQLAATRPATRP